jgi:hypothetical protein
VEAVTGPENYSATERLLVAADEYDAEGEPQTANQRRLEALVRAVLALTASHATHQHPESVAWSKVIES